MKQFGFYLEERGGGGGREERTVITIEALILYIS